MQGRGPRSGLALVLLTGVLCACGGGDGGGIVFNPDETTPTVLTTPDGRVIAEIPQGALDREVELTLTNRSAADAQVPGPAGRTLAMAMELGYVPPKPPPTEEEGTGEPANGGTASQASQTGTTEGDGTTETETEVTLGASVEITFILSPALPPTLPIPIYTYNATSERYAEASITGTIADDGTALTFSISEFGRYAFYGLLAEELPPDAPTGLKLLAASTQVRKLSWNVVPQARVTGYNLYRAEAGQESFAKVNNELLSVTLYSDELPDAGSFAYQVTAVSEAGLESDPGAAVQSPAVDFDVSLLFGTDVLDAPAGLALSAEASRLLVADSARARVFRFDLEGRHVGQITHYGAIAFAEPLDVAFSPGGEWIYVTDGGFAMCFIVDSDLEPVGHFGRDGDGPGEFRRPLAVAAYQDKVLVADSLQSTLKSFTPLGVYLNTLATFGTEDGFFDAPQGLAFTAEGKLYASDAGNARVQLLTAELDVESTLELSVESGGPLSAPSGLAEDFRGRLYVSDSGNRRVVVFDSAGELLFHFGSQGSKVVEFGPLGPAGLALDRTTGYLYVADPSNHRIAVFKS